MDDDEKWYVVETKPRNEFRAEQELSNQGYVSFLPLIRRRRLNGRGEHTFSEPLFRGYLFIMLSRISSSWCPIRYTRGVKGLVAFGSNDPLPVSRQIIDDVRDYCRQLSVQPLFKEGDSVRIAPPTKRKRNRDSTVFWGQLGSLDGEGRAVVLTSLLGREHRIQVATSDLRPA